MHPIDKLMEEHKIIKRAIDILEHMVHLAHSNELDMVDAKQLIEFIKVFADKCHHGKEEGILFPKMVEKGIPKEGGPIGVMLEEHEMGRDAVRRMARGIELIEKGDANGRNIFIDAALEYINLLRNHIDKEDDILYQMAKNVISVEEFSLINDAFGRVEREEIGEGVHEKYEQIISQLSKKYFGLEAHHH